MDHRPEALGPRVAGLARLLVAAPFYLVGLATMSTSVAVRGLLVGLVVGVLLAGVAAQAAAGPLPAVGYLGVGLLVGALGFAGFVGRARRILRARSRIQPAALLLSAREPTDEDERRAAGVLGRLARQVDLAAPELRVVDEAGPVCFTVAYPESAPPAGVIEDALGVRLDRDRTGDGPTPAAFADPVEADRVVVVSTGLLSTLSAAELEAVLAHELAHVRNGDLSLMNWLLVPVGWAESVVAAARNRQGRRGTVLAGLRGAAKLFAYAATIPGVAAFTRGREFAADRGGAEISGAPAALASALAKLDGDGTPAGDLRSAAAVNVVSPRRAGLPYSHPSTETRIERLREIAAADEEPPDRVFTR